MPQMAPMLWLTLYIYFIVVFIFYMILVYFMSLPTPSLVKDGEGYFSSTLMWSW